MNASDGRVMNECRLWVDKCAAEAIGVRVWPAGTIVVPKNGGAVLTNKKRVLGVCRCL